MSLRAVEVSSSSRQLPARVYYEFDTKLTAQFVPTRCWRYSCNTKLCYARVKQRSSTLGLAGLRLWLHTTDLSPIDSAKDHAKGKSYFQQENNARKPQAAITNAAIYEPTSTLLCIHSIALPRLASCAFSFGPPVNIQTQWQAMVAMV